MNFEEAYFFVNRLENASFPKAIHSEQYLLTIPWQKGAAGNMLHSFTFELQKK